ncbi:Six-hairpin glycosidase-like protein [Frateuria defendens]|uniref:Six-hairpin glycosidase-like protein n=1 Tax=Frateuria defendens TaxID=2219559 RepID=UPI00066FD961|nr:Six-hairpin glycosidase-like protein [Frateuria defendens]
MLSAMIAATLASAAAGGISPQGIAWRGAQATMGTTDEGGHRLAGPFGTRDLPAQPSRAYTASVLFDGLYAQAQDDLRQASVAAIRDDAFDHGQPIPCACFETGAQWHYVWTRDLSYALDLGLWRLDPARARASLRFKLSPERGGEKTGALYPMQDTGSGGSWPISTDRIVWFLGARHLLDDAAFADEVWRALPATLAQDRAYVYDAGAGLYRGETSFLDWREQSYPAWTANDVRFIAGAYALSTNVLQYEALKLAAGMASERHDARAADYAAQAAALKAAIDTHFWRADRGLYMSYLGPDLQPVDSYDLLGIALAVTSGVAEGERARQALANYPTWPAGSPVIWPERADVPIYHNRAIWPFVSAYALRAARAVDDPARIAHELRSLLRGAALAGSNMENFELTTQSTHVDDGPRSGPVVDSARQLWSVAGYLDMVTRGVFGLEDDGRVAPKLPAELVPLLFGEREAISLDLPGRHIALRLPAERHGNLLVADRIAQHGAETVVTLKAVQVPERPLRLDAPLYAPATPAAPRVAMQGEAWQVQADGRAVLYVDGRRHGPIDGQATLALAPGQHCFSLAAAGDGGLESLPTAPVCAGPVTRLGGSWPRAWTAPADGRYRLTLRYANAHGPINTGITAAVQWLTAQCEGEPPQRAPLVLAHSAGEQDSTSAVFAFRQGAACRFALEEGFNMSRLAHFAHYTGGAGGADGPLNHADVGDLLIAPQATEYPAR